MRVLGCIRVCVDARVWQRRVRAGAEPGWTACEGLLLLLRDTVAALPDHQLAQVPCLTAT